MEESTLPSAVPMGRGRGRGGGVPVLPAGILEALNDDTTLSKEPSKSFSDKQFDDLTTSHTDSHRSSRRLESEHDKDVDDINGHRRRRPSFDQPQQTHQHSTHTHVVRQRKDFNQEFPYENHASSSHHKHKAKQDDKDWTCGCGNLNWSWRTHCNVCHNVKPANDEGKERREGAGSGFFERQHRASMTTGIEVDADGFDDFGRRVTSSASSSSSTNNPPPDAPVVKKETKEEAALRRLQAKYAVLSFPTATSAAVDEVKTQDTRDTSHKRDNRDTRDTRDTHVNEYRQQSSNHNGNKSTDVRPHHNRDHHPRDTRDTYRERDTRGHNNAPRTRSRSRSRSRDTHRRQQQSSRGHSRDNRSHHTASKYGDSSYRR